MRIKVYIRVDASSEIGLGHLVRCIALAHMLKSVFEITFVCKQIPAGVISDLDDNNFKLLQIKDESFFFNEITANNIVVLDGYQFDIIYQKKIKAIGCKLVCIDDLHDQEFVADLIINHAPGVIAENYKAQPYTQFALGLNYVLLRSLFLEQAKKTRIINAIETVMICFGGADTKNLTKCALEVVLRCQQFKKIIVVTGAAYTFEKSIKNLVKENLIVEYHHAINEGFMLNIMLQSDLAIIPASGILQEAIAAKCRIISGMYVENQKNIFRKYKALRAFETAEDFSDEHITIAINKILSNTPVFNNFFDGESGTRLLKIFAQLTRENALNLRKLEKGDLSKTFKWASNNEIRKFFFNNEMIKYETHKKWFKSKLADKNCFYYIAEDNSKAIGSVRFDVEEDKAKISYLIDPLYQNNGWGTILLKMGLDLFLQQSKKVNLSIAAEVFPQNMASIKIFQKLGYSIEPDSSHNLVKFKKNII